MNRFIYTVFPVFFFLNGYTQQDHFMYIEQVGGHPFYVRLGEKSFSSSFSGHIIVPGLQEDSLDIYIGLPGEDTKEQLFKVVIQQKDRGFELSGSNGMLLLTDLQSRQEIRGISAEEKANAVQGIKKEDSYSFLMAGIVDDSAVLYTSMIRKEQIKEQDTVALVKKAKKRTAVRPVSKGVPKHTDPQPAAETVIENAPVAVNQNIVRFGSENQEEGKLIIYIDRTSEVADTIRVLIPRL